MKPHIYRRRGMWAASWEAEDGTFVLLAAHGLADLAGMLRERAAR